MSLFAGVVVLGNEAAVIQRVMTLGAVIGVCLPLAIGESFRTLKSPDAGMRLAIVVSMAITAVAIVVIF